MRKHPFIPGPGYWDWRCLRCDLSKKQGNHPTWEDQVLPLFFYGFGMCVIAGFILTLLIVAGVRF